MSLGPRAGSRTRRSPTAGSEAITPFGTAPHSWSYASEGTRLDPTWVGGSVQGGVPDGGKMSGTSLVDLKAVGLFMLAALFTPRAAHCAISKEHVGISRVSVASSGCEANAWSSRPAISADGRFVAFTSGATNLVPGDTNRCSDVFVYDRETGLTQRVSVDSYGKETSKLSRCSSFAADGRFVGFVSYGFDGPGTYLHDRQTGNTVRVSVDCYEGQAYHHGGAASLSAAASLCADVRFVAYDCQNMTTSRDVFVYDRETGQTERLTANLTKGDVRPSSQCPAISADGRYVAFLHYVEHMAPGDANDRGIIRVHDRETGRTEPLRVGLSGRAPDNFSCWPPSISADGRFVAFTSRTAGLVHGDANGCADVLVHDRETGQTERVSVASSGAEANGPSLFPSISADGRFVAFSSDATNLAPGGSAGRRSIYVHDRTTGKTEMVAVCSTNDVEDNWSYEPAISADGRFVAFQSYAPDLVFGDANGTCDVFVAPNPLAPDPPRGPAGTQDTEPVPVEAF